MHKEIFTFNSDEIGEMKNNYGVKTAKEALTKWVLHNYDIRHTNGLDFVVGRRRVTITQDDG